MKFLFSLLLATLALVSAHVTITPNQVPSGATTIFNFQLSHGCNATTLTNKVVVMFPQNITSMKPIDKVGWKLTRSSELLGYKVNGVDAFYYNFTWEVDPTIYQGLPDWAFDVLSVRVTVPAASAIAYGSKFTVPVWQHCTGGLTYAWISGPSTGGGDSHAPPGADGVTVSTAPTFTVLNPADIQLTPSQANVRSLVDKVTNLTATVQALAANTNPNPTTTAPPSGATTPPPIVNAGGNTINYYQDSSSSRSKADTVAVISIILASLSVIASILLTLKLSSLEKQNNQSKV